MDTDIAYQVVGSAMDVYRKLGPGLLESVYQRAMMIELDNRCLLAEEEVPINILYDGNNLGLGFRMDILVENTIVVELKSVSQLEKIHFKQLQTYLKLANKRIGYLINFNTDKFTIGNSIHKIINRDYSEI
ncbi:MAG: GxxExxY protein [Bacteroidales bacterium]|nr:GxxExxY protein [Bacteroidales bacterium]